ncbi:DUF6252 family protein [Hymenobacter properus]|uniref:Carboxypeptidase regulatory-like domain-containing protein n=1 Tax=Hymenobacter properus TaxID=2791026 RepID=A0A931BIG0_9BACT|nr:DUF6252 family protein [Hymenobacter properus]MBF9140778.1 carboxypeptidase regulatory-like domain-containing protein [Hymenobacter properus]MBR7719587.1 carboxypeptidase regulatory-like domain-containing protein [Microvirga sp. SRT04]
MNNKLYLMALCATLAGGSCTKKSADTPVPAPTPVVTGPAIIGSIQPADAVRAVTLSDKNTHQAITYAAVDAQGAYRFDAVPAGAYELLYQRNNNYIPPRQQTATVVAGQTTVIPLLTAARSTASFTADGVPFAPGYVDVNIGSQTFSLVLSEKQISPTFSLYLTMPYSVTVGTYPLNAAQTYAVFANANNETFDSRLNPATVPSGGTLTITAVENTAPFPRSISGTYSFTATSRATGVSKSFSGTFSNAYF